MLKVLLKLLILMYKVLPHKTPLLVSQFFFPQGCSHKKLLSRNKNYYSTTSVHEQGEVEAVIIFVVDIILITINSCGCS